MISRFAFAVALLLAPRVWAEEPVTLSLDSHGDPVVRFAFEPAQDEIRFADDRDRTYDEVRKDWWKFDTACYALTRKALRRLSPGCDSPVVKLEWDEQERDRMYPAVVKFRNGGALVFAGNIETVNPGSSLSEIRVIAPASGVAVFRGRKSPDSLVLRSDTFDGEGEGWLYLGPDRFVDETAGLLLVDDDVPPRMRAELIARIPTVMKLYTEGMGPLTVERPSIYLSWGARDRASRSWQADVVPGNVMRFGLSGKPWGTEDATATQAFVETIAHETAHLWNGHKFHAAENAAPWVLEGGAELLAVTAMQAVGAYDRLAIGDRIDRAIAECAVIAGMRAWIGMSERDRGRAPYACGLALQVAIVANLRRNDTSIDPISFWARFGSESTPYREASMTLFLAKHDAPHLAARLARLLTDPNVPFVAELRSMYADAAIALRPGSSLPANALASVGVKAFAALMAQACNGSYSFVNQGHQYLEIDKRLDCAAFKGGTKIDSIEGKNLFSQGVEVVAAIRSKCLAPDGSIAVSTVAMGDTFAVPCKDTLPRELPDVETMFGLAPGEAARIVTLAQPR